MPIFTSIPARPNVTPSDKFREAGNLTDMPCPIYETPIFAISSTTNPRLAAMRGNFQYHVAANILSRTVKAVGFVDTTIPTTTTCIPLVPTPPVGLSLPGMNAPGTKQTLHSLGFSEEAVGSRKFYRGFVELSNLSRVMQMNPIMDTGVPYGVTNLQGLMAFFWISSLLHGGFQTFSNRASLKDTVFGGDYGMGSFLLSHLTLLTNLVGPLYHASPIASRRIPVIIKANTDKLPSSCGGLVFPYFDGLVLPDKTGPIRFVLSHFANILGSDGAKSAEASHHLLQGWKSVASTASGMALSHVILCLDLALQSGACPALIQSPDKVYQGFVLVGAAFAIQKGPRVYLPEDKAELRKQLADVDTHGAAMRKIVDIINTYKEGTGDDAEPYDFRPSVITLPRQLHNIMRKISFKPEDTKEIRKNLKLLSFEQQYWNPKDTLHVERAIKKMSSEDFPDSSWPISYKTQVMFSTNRFQSILSSFGSLAPSLSLTSGSAVPLFKTKGKSTLTKTEGGRLILPEIPIFTRPVEECAIAWKKVFSDHQLYVKYKRNREGIDGAAKVVRPESDDGQSLFSVLMLSLPVKSDGRKRKLDDSEEGEKQESREKRQRRQLDVNVASSAFLLGRLGLGPSEEEPNTRADSEGMDEDDDEE